MKSLEFGFKKPFSSHIETSDAHWFFDGTARMYLKIPKHPHSDHPSRESLFDEALANAFWLPYEKMAVNTYSVSPECKKDFSKCCPHLSITITNSSTIYAPKAKIVSITTREGITI